MKTHCKISDVTAFLRRLEMNNDRTWFKDHKAEYDVIRQAWEADIERLIVLVSEYDEGCRGLDIKSSVYRIYRDIRFRKDKSPYKNYFSAVIGKGGRHTKISCNYVHFQPGKLMIGGGIWWPERPVLNELRSLIDAEGDEFLKIVKNPAISDFFHWDCDTLKKMPKEYDASNPMAEYLKMKEYIMIADLDEAYFDCDDWVAKVADDLRRLQPMHDFLNYVFHLD